MSLHHRADWPLPEQLVEALKNHGLEHDTPSQLADSFRLGWKSFAAATDPGPMDAENQILRAENDSLRATLDRIAAMDPEGVRADDLGRAARIASEARTVRYALHPRTADLVDRFAAALKEKLAAAERKYGYSVGWANDDWQQECAAKLLDHAAKGDPRDVAAYCAFMWHHGWSTTPAAPAIAPTDLIRAAMEKADFTYQPTKFAQALIDEICARIKAADDKASEDDYMLDSDDCISVIRGTWGVDPTKPAIAPAILQAIREEEASAPSEGIRSAQGEHKDEGSGDEPA